MTDRIKIFELRKSRKVCKATSVAATEGGLSEITLNLAMPGAGWVTAHNDARQGVIGCTIQRHFIAIPSPVHGDYYFWYTMDDGNGNQVGFDPGDYETSLAGFTGVQVQLSNGVRTPRDVAIATRSAMNAIYGAGNLSVFSTSVRLTGYFVLDDVFVGSPWTSRGSAGYWGAQRYVRNGLGHVDGFSAGGNINGSFAAHMTAPAINNNRLQAIQFLIGANTGSDIRLLLYSGASAGDPEGATLIYDSGVIDAADLVAQTWNTHYLTEDLEIGNAASLWLTLICEASSTTALNFQSIAAGDIGEFTSQDLRVGGLTNNVNDTPASSFPSGSSASGANLTPAMRIVYAAAPYAGDGQWQRNQWPTPNIAPGDWPAVSAGFSNQIVCGGVFPPQVGGLFAYRIGCSMARGTTGLGARLWLMQGGAIRDPQGADVLTNSQVRMNHTDTSVDHWYVDYGTPIFIDTSQRIWLGCEGDGVSDVHFQLISSGGHFNIAPRWGNVGYSNPLDWPDNVVGASELEFENIDNIDQEVDPANATEDPYPTGLEIGPSFSAPVPPGDTFVAWRPENVTPQVVDLRTNTFIITEL